MEKEIKITKWRRSQLLVDYSYIQNAKVYREAFLNDNLPKIIREIEKVKDNPRALVLITHGFLEMMIDILVKNKCENQGRILSNGQTFSHSTKLIILNEIGVIDNESYKIYDKFRKLRNSAAHKPFFDFDNMDTGIKVKGKEMTSGNLLEFCQLSIFSLWNKYTEIFAPIWASTAMGAGPVFPRAEILRSRFRREGTSPVQGPLERLEFS